MAEKPSGAVPEKGEKRNVSDLADVEEQTGMKRRRFSPESARFESLSSCFFLK